MMKKIPGLLCYHLGLWGILGFFITLLFGFIACCANLSENVFFTSLFIFAIIGITATILCVTRGCKKIQ